MVVEGIVFDYLKKNKKIGFVVASFIYTAIAILLSMTVFYHQSSLLYVFLVILAFVPFIHKTISMQEAMDEHDRKFLIKTHSKTLTVYMLLFLGVLLATAFFYILLPPEHSSVVFLVQQDALMNVRTSVQGQVTGFGNFMNILKRNMVVLALCLVFSLVYGLGAIFVLTWNASVIGVAIGETIRLGISEIGKFLGWGSLVSYIGVISYGLFRYFIHGFFEILGYFAIGLAGGILSVAILKHHFHSRSFYRVVADAADLAAVSIALIIIGAFLEVYVTPVFF